MQSSNGNAIPNQFVITDVGKNIRYFQSYHSMIAKIYKGKVTLDKTYWNYSRTTGKYRNQFLGEGILDTRRKIKSGEYKLVDLN